MIRELDRSTVQHIYRTGTVFLEKYAQASLLERLYRTSPSHYWLLACFGQAIGNLSLFRWTTGRRGVWSIDSLDSPFCSTYEERVLVSSAAHNKTSVHSVRTSARFNAELSHSQIVTAYMVQVFLWSHRPFQILTHGVKAHEMEILIRHQGASLKESFCADKAMFNTAKARLGNGLSRLTTQAGDVVYVLSS